MHQILRNGISCIQQVLSGCYIVIIKLYNHKPTPRDLLVIQSGTFPFSKMSSGLQTNLLKHAWRRNRTLTPANCVTRRTAAAGNNAAFGTFCTPRPSSRLTAPLAVSASAEQAELMLSSDSCIGSVSTSSIDDGAVELLASAASAGRLATSATASNSETPSPSGTKGEISHTLLNATHPLCNVAEGACSHEYIS